MFRWIGGGNTGRNTTIIRSNYLYDESAHLYDHAVKLWDGLSQELNYNVMYSKRGVMMLAHNVHDVQSLQRHINANRLNGVDNEWLTPQQAKDYCPPLNISPDARHPVLGAALQRRGGTARHDSVAWGYARAAAALGVDIIQNCAVTAIRRGADGAVEGVETTRGPIATKRIGVSAAGNTSVVMQMAGLDFPLESYPLQALVSEPVKPCLDTVVMSNAVHGYISQSDKGGMVFGGNLDGYNSYAQKGNLPLYTDVASCAMNMMPALGRVKLLRQWAGIMDMSMDGSPFITKTDINGLYLNAGWCYGGFKATPASGWCFAHTIAHDAPHDVNKLLTLDRYKTGHMLDESGHGPYPKSH